MNIREIATNYYQYFLRGTQTTILISLLTVFCGSILGCLIAFMRLSKFKPLEKFASIYITVIRGTPMLVQLYIVYYQLDFISYPTGTLFGVDLERALPCIIALSINSSAYVAEIIRGGIQSIPVGQHEASQVLGLTKAQTFFHIVLPQVMKRVLLPVSNEVITLVKDTSLANVIAVSELFRAAKNEASRTASIEPLFVAGLFYLLMNGVVSLIFNRLNRRMAYYKD